MTEPRYCFYCGGRLALGPPGGADRPRPACTVCARPHYENPKVIANLLPERDGRVLLLRRGIEPARGKWTYPGGYLEMGETAREGAERECFEEIGLRLSAGPLLGVYDLLADGLVVVVFRARLSGDPAPGPEVLETALFASHQIPWPDLAFESTAAALRDWVDLAGR